MHPYSKKLLSRYGEWLGSLDTSTHSTSLGITWCWTRDRQELAQGIITRAGHLTIFSFATTTTPQCRKNEFLVVFWSRIAKFIFTFYFLAARLCWTSCKTFRLEHRYSSTTISLPLDSCWPWSKIKFLLCLISFFTESVWSSVSDPYSLNPDPERPWIRIRILAISLHYLKKKLKLHYYYKFLSSKKRHLKDRML